MGILGEQDDELNRILGKQDDELNNVLEIHSSKLDLPILFHSGTLGELLNLYLIVSSCVKWESHPQAAQQACCEDKIMNVMRHFAIIKHWIVFPRAWRE